VGSRTEPRCRPGPRAGNHVTGAVAVILERLGPSISWAPDQVRRVTLGNGMEGNGKRATCHSEFGNCPLYTSFPRRRESIPTRPIPVPEEAAWWVAATSTAMTWVGWDAVLVLRSWSAPYRAAGARTGKRTARHSRARPSSNTSFPRMRETTPTWPITVPEAAARWVAATGAAMTWVGWDAVLVLRSWSAPRRMAGTRTGKRTAHHSRARPSSNTSFPRLREPNPTWPITAPEGAARWVAATGAAMTWVG